MLLLINISYYNNIQLLAMETKLDGLLLYPDFIDGSMEEALIREIDGETWVVDYERRLQYYGYRNELETPYDLVTYPVPMPRLMRELARRIVEQKILHALPDQVIVNEYVPGKGIVPHKDRNYFDNQICGVNLGSGCIMRFTKTSSKEFVDIEIPRRSVYVMQDDARYKWKHSIPPRKKDTVDGNVQHRERRVSITYRKVKPEKVRPINPAGKVASVLKEQFGIEINQIIMDS